MKSSCTLPRTQGTPLCLGQLFCPWCMLTTCSGAEERDSEMSALHPHRIMQSKISLSDGVADLHER